MIYCLYVLVSAVGGLVVGVLGTGSSFILLPSLVLIFSALLPEIDPLRLAAGTTMATIAVGAIAGGIAQYRAGNVDLPLFRLTLAPYIVGSLAGPWINRLLPVRALGIYVSVLILIVASRMLLVGGDRLNTAEDYRAHRLPVSGVLVLISLGSSIAGIASGVFAIPYLSRFSLPMRTVVGTSTASAAVYALVGAAGFVSAGWSAPDLPPGHLGFVYLPAFAVMATTASILTPLGVRLARYADDRLLRVLFAVFLFSAAAAIAYTR